MKWTKESVTKAACSCDTMQEFRNNFSGARKHADRNGYAAELSSLAGWKHRLSFTFDEIVEAAKQYPNRNDFKMSETKLHVQMQAFAQRNGWMDDVWAITGAPRQMRRVHTVETILADAAKCENSVDMAKRFSSAYQTGCKLGILPAMIAMMSGENRPTWDLESAREVAAQYEFRSVFQREAKGPYLWAVKRGHLDEICAHMDYMAMGFKMDIPAILYYLRVDSVVAGTLYKIGITNHDIETRFRAEDLAMITVVKTWAFDLGRAAKDRENEIKTGHAEFAYTGENILISNGNTELFTKDILELDPTA